MSEILFADDDAATRQMVAAMLRADGHGVRLAEDGRAALAEIRRTAPDLVILDYRMGPPDGLAICRDLKSDPQLEYVPVLILTAEGGVEDRIEGFDAGADDYLPKPFDARELQARVRALLRLARQGMARNPTTGLPGGEAIHREFEQRRERGDLFALGYFDLDHFKAFNDHFGFAQADRVIQAAADALRGAAGAGDFVGHIGGDDFVLVTERASARARCEAAQRAFAERLRALLPPEVVERGGFSGVDRDGTPRDFPLTRLSAVVVPVDPETARSLDELGAVVARTKREAKREERSGVVEVQPPR